MQHLSETAILKRYSQPPGDSLDENKQQANNAIEPFPASPIDYPPDTFEKGIKRRHKNRQMLLEWINENLVVQIDFGKVHFAEHCAYAHNGSADLCINPSHWSKPVLWKGGCEKILGVLGLTAHFPNLETFEKAVSHKQELNQVILKCQLKTHNGTVIGEGVGASLIKQDGYDLNCSIKAAARLSMVDATSRTFGLTNVFGQNNAQGKSMPTKSSCNTDKLTNMGDCNTDKPTDMGACQSHNNQQKSTQTQLITRPQKDLILKLAGRLGLTIEGLEKRCKDLFNSPLKDLERHHASRLISQLNGQF